MDRGDRQLLVRARLRGFTELPNGIAAAGLAAAAGATGAITDFETHEIFGHEEQAAIVAAAAQARGVYRPPTA